jgi:hypothetical protein
MRAVSDPDQYPPLCLTSEQINAGKALNAALDQPGVQLIEPIHSFSYALMSACPPKVAGNQFLSPHILYLIYSNTRADGTLEAPETISKCLSKISWVIRGTAVYEALEHGEEYPDDLLG